MKKEISNTAQTAINMVASAITYVVTLAISFFLSPYIVRNIGVDANGFITLANNFINYVALISIALNTLSSRFVTINIVKEDYENANKYYSSVFFSNLFISGIIAAFGTFLIVFMNKILDVPDRLLPDVRLLFAVLFLNSVISTIGTVFSIATFATNKLYISSIVTIITNLIRVISLLTLFSVFSPKLYFVGLSSLIATVVLIICNYIITRKLLPPLKIDCKNFQFKKVKELVSGGIWSSVNRLGAILLNDLDLLITNIFIDATSMGVLSLSKTVPNAINGVVGNIVQIFAPNYTRLYAEEKKEELISAIKQSMKIMGIITNIPVIVLVVCGERFYKLWQPTQDAHILYILSILTIGYIIISGGINCIYNIFTVVNKLMPNAIAVIICGIINTLVVLILLKTTDLGIYAVAGVSTVLAIIRNLVFTVPYGAICLKIKWYSFYPDVIRNILFVVISSLPCLLIESLIKEGGWLSLIALGIIVVSVSAFLGYFIILNKKDRALVNGIIKSKILKRGE